MKKQHRQKKLILTMSIAITVIFTLAGCKQETRPPISANAENLPQLDCTKRAQKAIEIEQLAKDGKSMREIYDALTPETSTVLEKGENMMLIPPIADAVQKNEFKGTTYVGEQCEKNRAEYWGYQAQVCAIFSPIFQLAVNERDGGNTTQEEAKALAAKKIAKLIGSSDSERNLLAGNVMTEISDQIVRDAYAQPQKPLSTLIEDFNGQCMFASE